MKRLILSVVVLILAATSCKKNGKEEFSTRASNADSNPAGLPEVILPEVICGDLFLSADTLYVLDGPTYVGRNAMLVVQAGTRIEGVRQPDDQEQSGIIVGRGGVMEAQGTRTQPIVLTSHI